MKKFSSKYLYISLTFFLLSCGENQKSSNNNLNNKKSVVKEETEKTNSRKHKIDSLNKVLEWKKIKPGLWMNNNGEIGIKTVDESEKSVVIDKYITELCCEGKPLKSVIDTASFEYLGSSFYKDKKHIYTHYIRRDGGNFWIVKEADISTFEIIGDCYAKDKNHIYGERAMVMNFIDYKTFQTKKGIGCFAKDKNGYYFWDEKIESNEMNDSIVYLLENI